ncbi:hypothetical protein [Faecalibaculum rodentium]|uniref:hypothetical protein n=1 Tax=Faecalibaculum rodentium TaxID=1702221 RepID=UPI0023F50D0B|nr:hypothetical protein [Faecalibaculum rodentium]
MLSTVPSPQRETVAAGAFDGRAADTAFGLGIGDGEDSRSIQFHAIHIGDVRAAFDDKVRAVMQGHIGRCFHADGTGSRFTGDRAGDHSHYAVDTDM